MASRSNNSFHPRRVPPRRGRSTFLRPERPLPIYGYTVLITAPPNGYAAHTLLPTITVVGTSVSATPVDIQVEWRTTPPTGSGTTWTPAPTYTNELLANPSGSSVNVTPPAPLSYRQWYYRARAGSKSLNLWTNWTAAGRYLEVQPVIGSVTNYLDLNVGVTLVAPSASAYMDLNIGVNTPDELVLAVAYSDLNVGIKYQWILAAAYSDLNVYSPSGVYQAANYTDLNVTGDRPDPYIWWIRPEFGKEGYLFNIFGHGFGSVQGQYDGVVYLGGLLCPVTRWSLVSDSSSPTVPRVIIHGQGLDPDVITVEHGWITVIVPPGAVSAMVQVVLEG